MIKLQINFGRKGTKEFFVPEKWDELSGEQLEAVCSALMTITEPIKKKVELARVLTGIEQSLFSKINPEVIHAHILPLVEWTEEHMQFSKQLIPSIKVGDVVLYGPASGLINLRLAEWDYSEQALLDWFDKDNKLLQLSRLVAILYRPGKENYNVDLNPDGDIRIPFNDNVVSYYTNLVAKTVPVSVLFAVLFWYRGCRNIITEQFSTIFLSDNKTGANKSEAGYYDLIRAIANQGTYGDFEKVEKMYLGNALHELKCAKDEVEALNSKK